MTPEQEARIAGIAERVANKDCSPRDAKDLRLLLDALSEATRDYREACTVITQLEANVQEARDRAEAEKQRADLLFGSERILAADNASLRAELAAARERTFYDDAAIQQWRGNVERLEAELAAAREALGPNADLILSEIAALRAAGCNCKPRPLLGHHENGPRCRLCNVEVALSPHGRGNVAMCPIHTFMKQPCETCGHGKEPTP